MPSHVTNLFPGAVDKVSNERGDFGQVFFKGEMPGGEHVLFDVGEVAPVSECSAREEEGVGFPPGNERRGLMLS
jgi:hypothetical protein